MSHTAPIQYGSDEVDRVRGVVGTLGKGQLGMRNRGMRIAEAVLVCGSIAAAVHQAERARGWKATARGWKAASDQAARALEGQGLSDQAIQRFRDDVKGARCTCSPGFGNSVRGDCPRHGLFAHKRTHA
jgi:hypothetical protein